MNIRNRVLVVTSSKEPNVDRVLPILKSCGGKPVRVNTDCFFDSVSVHFEMFGPHSEWVIETLGEKIHSSEIKSVWYRRPNPPDPSLSETISQAYYGFVEDEVRKFLWSLWTSTNDKDILWVNHPLTLKLLEYNKIYQLQTACKVGLDVPETIVTMHQDKALRFFDRCRGQLVMKLLGSGGNLKNDEGKDLVVYTNRVSREHIIECRGGMKQAPVMLQRYIPKKIELRITIVGRKAFACGIDSQVSSRTKDDWRRYDFERVGHTPYKLLESVERKLLRFMEILGLNFGAIDMIVTPKDEYVFLEVNPSGQWGWIESLTGMPISKALADLLIAGKN